MLPKWLTLNPPPHSLIFSDKVTLPFRTNHFGSFTAPPLFPSKFLNLTIFLNRGFFNCSWFSYFWISWFLILLIHMGLCQNRSKQITNISLLLPCSQCILLQRKCPSTIFKILNKNSISLISTISIQSSQ